MDVASGTVGWLWLLGTLSATWARCHLSTWQCAHLWSGSKTHVARWDGCGHSCGWRKGWERRRGCHEGPHASAWQPWQPVQMHMCVCVRVYVRVYVCVHVQALGSHGSLCKCIHVCVCDLAKKVPASTYGPVKEK
eukprot:1159739-Pelagomonas_calceolata.AAC.5